MKTALLAPSPDLPELLASARATPAEGVPASCRSREELEEENEALRREIAELQTFRTLAYRDALTGLWNRRYFDERLAEELGRARRSGNAPFSILLIDVNDLKRINDQRGHQAGDEALAAVATFLRATLRAHDVCCRTGGDEFAVLLPGASQRDCAGIVQRLRRELAAAQGRRGTRGTLAGAPLPVGLAFGAATCPDQGNTPADMVAHADEVMYRDKRRQKARTSSQFDGVSAVPRIGTAEPPRSRQQLLPLRASGSAGGEGGGAVR